MVNNSLSEFRAIWDRLVSNPDNKSLNYAIYSWYKEICIDDNLRCEYKLFDELINNWIKENSVANSVFRLCEIIVKLGNYNFLYFIPIINSQIDKNEFTNTYKTINTKKDLKMDIQIIILIAFILTCIGLILYFLNQRRKTPVQSDREIKDYSYLSPNSENKIAEIPEKQRILILVINAQQEQIIQSLQGNQKIISNDCESLYRNTKYLWMGTEAEFYKSGLKTWLDNIDCSVSENEESEYDIYLVQIELKEYESGFEKNVVNRLPAFQKLPDISKMVKVSKRLPSKAYSNSNLYK